MKDPQFLLKLSTTAADKGDSGGKQAEERGGLAGISETAVMRLVFEHALDVSLGECEHNEAVAELTALARHDRSAVEAARVRAMGLVMTRPNDDVGRTALSLLDEVLRRGDERRRWHALRSFDPWDVAANTRR